MAHWIHSKGNGLLNEIENAVNGTGWSIDVSNSDEGPIELEHEDGSTASLVQSSFTETLAVEYEPGDDSTAGVHLNKGDYHHTSFAYNDGDDAVEQLVNVVEMHESKN